MQNFPLLSPPFLHLPTPHFCGKKEKEEKPEGDKNKSFSSLLLCPFLSVPGTMWAWEIVVVRGERARDRRATPFLGFSFQCVRYVGKAEKEEDLQKTPTPPLSK